MKHIEFLENFKRMTHDAWLKGWHERNGGNISYRLSSFDIEECTDLLMLSEDWIELPMTVENLANDYFLVTGSGKFLRNIMLDIESNCGIVQLNQTGNAYRIVWGLLGNAAPTSEFPSHLLSHSVKKNLTGGRHRVIMHSHLTNVIALTFVLPLCSKTFTSLLWQMMTECPVVFPSGVGVVQWMVPGSVEIGVQTSKLMEKHDVVIWSHHGVFGSGESMDLTFGLMDTVEKSAEILVKVLSMGGVKQTISEKNMEDLANAFQIDLHQ